MKIQVFEDSNQANGQFDVPGEDGLATRFVIAGQPGTYFYESGTDMGKQVNMGLFGGMIVRLSRNTSSTKFAYDREDARYNPQAEYLMIFSEVDPALHQAVEHSQKYDITTNNTRY